VVARTVRAAEAALLRVKVGARSRTPKRIAGTAGNLDPATKEGRRPGGLVRASHEGNEAVTPPCFDIGIGIAIENVIEGSRPRRPCARVA